MGKKIALGFHACVDFELEWNKDTIETLIKAYDVRPDELTCDMRIDSERKLLLASLGYMKEGMGCEFVPESPEICTQFAQRFHYKITIGGTAARAAIAVSKLGYESVLQGVSYNLHIKKLLPSQVHYFSSVGEQHNEIYPHVVLSYPSGVHIHANDVDFVTPRENRILFSRDADSLNMVISKEFAPMIKDAEVMLLSCFSEVLDRDILRNRISRTLGLLKALPKYAYVVFEDGCYANRESRYYVHRRLSGALDALSMNEDEMQEYTGHRVNMKSPEEVLAAIKHIYAKIHVPTLIIHSADWALAYGRDAKSMRHVLEGGILLSSARFLHGDDFGRKEYEAVKTIPEKESGKAFADRICQLSEAFVCCVATKDLRSCENPVVVGLGDFFAGGLLPELTLDKRKLCLIEH